MKINLFQSYFIDSDPARQQELDTCLKKNIFNPLITKIYLIIEGDLSEAIVRDLIAVDITKLVLIRRPGIPTYKDFFNLIAEREPEEDSINIISNLDIYFNETLSRLHVISETDVYCLSRWEEKEDGSIQQLRRNDSQDAWIFRGKIYDQEMDCDFCMGIPGCDNRIAWEFDQTYKVSNPSNSIQSIHLHLTNKRNYTDGKDARGNDIVKYSVPQPYKMVRPDYI